MYCVIYRSRCSCRDVCAVLILCDEVQEKKNTERDMLVPKIEREGGLKKSLSRLQGIKSNLDHFVSVTAAIICQSDSGAETPLIFITKEKEREMDI